MTRASGAPKRYKDLIGNTPMVDLSGLLRDPLNPDTKVFAKCEFLNPGFSMKDRIVKNILDKAMESGKLKLGMTVVAASSGNTGASTAMMCAMRGLQCVVTTTSKCSQEKRDAIRAYGATLHVSPPGTKEGEPLHYMEMARSLVRDCPEKYFDLDQYDSQDNPEAHYKSLGPEVWAQTDGAITHFVAGSSTGGTISGTGRFLKEQNPEVRVVLADPVGSIFCEYVRSRTMTAPKKFLVEGVGKGSIPGAMDITVVDKVVQVTDQQAFDMCSEMAHREGICAGGSSGLNVHAALRLAESLEEPAVVVTILCDLGVKYLTKVYNADWLKANGLDTPPAVLPA